MFRWRRQVYLDNNATTAPARDVVRVMTRILRTCHGNPSSSYRHARDAAELLQNARATLAQTINTNPEQLIFTSCASEANNQVLTSCLSMPRKGRCNIVASPIEHPSVTVTLEHLASQGIEIRWCPVDCMGHLQQEKLGELIDEHTLLVCCMLANNETGVIQDIQSIARLAHQHGALMMCDCVQALGKIPVDIAALEIDYAIFSAHKLHGPKGIGALYVREGAPISPFIRGGHQENGLRAGTEGLHNIAGFAQACLHIPELLAAAPRIRERKNRLAQGILHILPTAQQHSFDDMQGLPNTLSITLPGFDGGEAIAFLDYHGIGVSAGSACNTQANQPSHVLKAIGLSDEEARQTLRFSLGDHTSIADIDYCLAVLRDYLLQRNMPVTMIRPDQVNETLLFNPEVFILDIRYGYDRKLLKGLPNSHETSMSALKNQLAFIPANKQILITCQAGTDGPMAAYMLRAKGYRHVSFVMGGVVGWKLFQPALYRQYGDYNKKPLQTE